MKIKLRYKIGAWLLRPYIRLLMVHYRYQVSANREAGRNEEAQNCEYILIGLGYARNPRSHRA